MSPCLLLLRGAFLSRVPKPGPARTWTSHPFRLQVCELLNQINGDVSVMFKNHEKCQLNLVERMEGKMCHVTRGADPVWSSHESLWSSGRSLDSGQMFEIFLD